MESRIGFLLLLAAFAACAVQAGPLGCGSPAPVPLSRAESSALQAREAHDRLATQWGRAFARMDEMRDALVKPRPFTGEEFETLRERQCETLGQTAAGGAWTVWKRILLFIPDRFLDCVDMATGDVGIGCGIGAEAHVTRWVGIGAGARAAIGVLWYYNRNLTPPIPAYGALAVFGPFQAYSLGFAGAGTGWTKGRPGVGGKIFNKAGVFSVQDKMVQEGWSDPYGVGLGWAAEIHPIEVADFVVGLVTVGFVDISRDDFALPRRSPYKIGVPVR